jgi:hypothetical protein
LGISGFPIALSFLHDLKGIQHRAGTLDANINNHGNINVIHCHPLLSATISMHKPLQTKKAPFVTKDERGKSLARYHLATPANGLLLHSEPCLTTDRTSL